tara:strand:- start:2441 stop:2767 length:327 start_codon:yes stop_codon:yes gene_type:complete
MLIVLSILTSVLAISLCVSLFYVFKFARIILNIEECVEDAIAELDESYNNMSDILEKPIFFDSIEVRQTIDEISSARGLILEIAEKLTASMVIQSDSENLTDEEVDIS